jgi:hypothetical protein
MASSFRQKQFLAVVRAYAQYTRSAALYGSFDNAVCKLYFALFARRHDAHFQGWSGRRPYLAG